MHMCRSLLIFSNFNFKMAARRPYWIFCFRTVILVWLWISTTNLSGIILINMARGLFIFKDITFKMAAWRPYWIFWFPDSNFSLALNINSKLQWHNTYVYGQEPIDFQWPHFLNGCLVAIFFLAATKQLYKWYFPSVCLSVCLSVWLSVRLSVCLSHLFHHVPIIVSSWNFQELLPWSRVMSMQKVKVRGQRSRSQRSTPNLAVSGL